MKKRVQILVCALIVGVYTSSVSLSFNPGINAWDMFNQTGLTLADVLADSASMVPILFSNISSAEQSLSGIDSVADVLSMQTLPEKTSIVDSLISYFDMPNSLIEYLVESSLVGVESQVDHIPVEIEQSLSDDFSITWTTLHALTSQVDVVAASASVFDSVSERVVSLLDVAEGNFVTALSDIDGAIALVSQADVCCNELAGSLVPAVSSALDQAHTMVSEIDSLLDGTMNAELLGAASSADVIAGEASLIEVVYGDIASKTQVIESKVDAFGGSVPSSACDAQAITSGDFIASNYTISTSGSYCLAENVSGGTITISSNDVSLELNNYKIGALTFTAGVSRIVVRNGEVMGAVTVKGNDIIIEGVIGNSGYSVATAHRVVLRRCISFYRVDLGDDVVDFSFIEGLIEILGIPSVYAVYVAPSTIPASNILIKDSKIELTGLSDEGVVLDGTSQPISSVSIINTTITGASTAAVLFIGGVVDTLTVQGCLLTGNVGGVQVSVVGIGDDVKNIAILNNTFSSNSNDAIFLGGVQYVRIAHNIMRNNGNGIFFSGVVYGSIDHNSIDGNSGIGINFATAPSDSSYCTIEHNKVINNSGGNILLKPTTPANNNIVSNITYTTATTSTGNNYNDITLIPTIEWDRSSGTRVAVSGAVAPTAWHNVSSIA